MGEAKAKKQKLGDDYGKDPLELLIDLFAKAVIREMGEDKFASLIGNPERYKALKDAIAPETMEFMALYPAKAQDALTKMFVHIHVALDEQENTQDSAICLLLASDVMMPCIQNQMKRELGVAAVEITFRQIILGENIPNIKAQIKAVAEDIEEKIQTQ